MNKNRKLILEVTLDIRGQLKRQVNNINWYYNNEHEKILDLIYKETAFLSKDKSLIIRLEYIKNNLYEIKKCIVCNKEVPYKYGKLLDTCGEKKCISEKCRLNSTGKHPSEETKLKASIAVIKFYEDHPEKREEASIRGKNIPHKSGHTLTKEHRQHISEGGMGKHDHDDKWKANMSVISKKLHKDPEYRKKINTPDANKKRSVTVLNKILSGEFIPNISNRCTHFEIEVDDKKFRSSWEGLFYLLNKNCEYEKIRIPYFYENKKHVYITDFVDYEKRVIYEIKPSSECIKPKNAIKIQTGKLWSKENNYKYILLNENWVKENANKINYDQYPQLYKKLKSFLKK